MVSEPNRMITSSDILHIFKYPSMYMLDGTDYRMIIAYILGIERASTLFEGVDSFAKGIGLSDNRHWTLSILSSDMNPKDITRLAKHDLDEALNKRAIECLKRFLQRYFGELDSPSSPE